MRVVTVLGLATVLAIGVTSAAEARDGCGHGRHYSNNYGRCVTDRSHAAYVSGRYYPHRGYWYGGRWYHDRYRYHDQWRYR